MELRNEKKIKKVERVYLVLNEEEKWFADTQERKWFGGLAIPNDEFKTLNFGKYIDVDFEFKKLIGELTGNYDEIYGVEAYFSDINTKDIIENYYLSDFRIERLHKFINGYLIAKKYYKHKE